MGDWNSIVGEVQTAEKFANMDSGQGMKEVIVLSNSVDNMI